MKITVIGAGYVGLVQSVCLADFGFNVTCIEKNLDKLEELKLGNKLKSSSLIKSLCCFNKTQITFID